MSLMMQIVKIQVHTTLGKGSRSLFEQARNREQVHCTAPKLHEGEEVVEKFRRGQSEVLSSFFWPMIV